MLDNWTGFTKAGFDVGRGRYAGEASEGFIEDRSAGDVVFYCLGLVGELGIWVGSADSGCGDPGCGESAFHDLFGGIDCVVEWTAGGARLSGVGDRSGKLDGILRTDLGCSRGCRDSGASGYDVAGNDHGSVFLFWLLASGKEIHGGPGESIACR